MSKIEAYRQAKARAERFAKFNETVRRSDCDKFGATVKLISPYYGFYGSSSSSGWADDIIEAVQREIAERLKTFIAEAAKTAAHAAVVARREAEAEAREVLQELTPA